MCASTCVGARGLRLPTKPKAHPASACAPCKSLDMCLGMCLGMCWSMCIDICLDMCFEGCVCMCTPGHLAHPAGA